MRLGLCCTFLREPIRFRRTTARYLSRLDPPARAEFLRELLLHNAEALEKAVAWCADHGILAFRLSSHLLPVYTHPEVGYRLDAIDGTGTIRERLAAAGALARALGVRLSLHPDPFVVLGSPNDRAVRNSIEELEYHGLLARIVGAEQVTIHAGGAPGGKAASLARLRANLDRLRPATRALLALENDDRTYTVADLLPLCHAEGIPLVFDVHHHRVHGDGSSEDEAAEACFATWKGREPWAHVSSPRGGWEGPTPRLHADYVDPSDVPRDWPARRLTVDVEAKAKELAVLRLQRDLGLIAAGRRSDR